MPLPTRPNQESASLRSEQAHHSGWLATRDHRDDGPVIGGLIIMLSVALPIWVMMITLFVSLLG